MFELIWCGTGNAIRYDTENDAWRAAHELLEESFGENYGDTEISDYNVARVAR